MKKISKKAFTFIMSLLLMITFINPTISYADDSIITKPVVGDFDGNGKVDSTDYALMKRYLLGQIKHFPAEARIISSVDNISNLITQNSQYTLPDFVPAIMMDGTQRNVPVVWNSCAVDTSKAGQSTYIGSVAGYNDRITLTLSITSSTQQLLTYNLGSDPKTIDPTLCASVDSSNVINSTFESLTRITSSMIPGPGVASMWDISDDGRTYTFHLRSNAKWSDGASVTANDFYYSWSRLLNPETQTNSASQLFCIKNAEDYHNGKCSSLSEVGIKVIDPLTFEVTLTAPTPYFLELCSSANLAPERADIVNANPTTWASSPQTYIGNGPFMLSAWTHGSSLEFVKNPYYWNASNIKLDKMIWSMINDSDAYMTAWNSGTVDIVNNPPASMIQQLQTDGKLTTVSSLGTYYLALNTSVAPFNNVKFRKALALAINRDVITNDVLRAGQISAGAFVPPGIKENTTMDFRSTPVQYYDPSGNVSAAQQLLSQSDIDISNLSLTYLYNSGSNHEAIAEAIQTMWKENLGINVSLEKVDWPTLQTATGRGNYQIARMGWMADYSDPMTFLDMFVTGSGNNYYKYSNPDYDSLIDSAKNETDPAIRMKKMHQAEDILMNDMPIIPLYYYTNNSCISPNVKGFYITHSGISYFDNAVMISSSTAN